MPFFTVVLPVFKMLHCLALCFIIIGLFYGDFHWRKIYFYSECWNRKNIFVSFFFLTGNIYYFYDRTFQMNDQTFKPIIFKRVHLNKFNSFIFIQYKVPYFYGFSLQCYWSLPISTIFIYWLIKYKVCVCYFSVHRKVLHCQRNWEASRPQRLGPDSARSD